MNNRLKNPGVWMPLALALALVGGMWIGKTFFNNYHGWDSRSKLDTILELISRNNIPSRSTLCIYTRIRSTKCQRRA